MKCWLCEAETEIDKGDLVPGEISINPFGDPECVHCTEAIRLTVIVMDTPGLARKIADVGAAIQKAEHG